MCGSSPLKMLFLNIFQMDENHMAKVMECMKPSHDRIIWCPTLRRNAFDWVLLSKFRLLDRLYNIVIFVDQSDQRV